MANYSRTQLSCLQQLSHVLVEPFDNPLHNHLGVWPEQAFVIDDNGILIFRGDLNSMGLPGMRNDSFAEQLESVWSHL